MKTRFQVFWQFVSWLLFIKCHYGLLIRAIGNSLTDLHCSLSLPMFCISHNLICVPQDQFPSKLWQEMNMVIENSCITGKSSFHLSVECFLVHLPYCTWWRFLWNNIQMGSDIKPVNHIVWISLPGHPKNIEKNLMVSVLDSTNSFFWAATFSRFSRFSLRLAWISAVFRGETAETQTALRS